MRIATLFVLALIGARLIPAQTTFVPIGGNRVTSDASGNLYVAATQGSLPDPYESPSSQVTVLAKFDSQGDVMWAYPFSGLVTAVAVNSQGDLVFASASTVNALDTSGNLLYTTTLKSAVAGVPTTVINGLTLDASGNVYVTGATSSGTFPVSANAFQKLGPPASNGIEIPVFAFVTVLSPVLDQVLYSTFLGSSEIQCVVGDACGLSAPYSAASAIAVGTDGSIVVAGSTNSNGFPVTQDASETICNCSFEYDVGFVVSLKSDLSALNWSTFLGAPASGVLASTVAEGLAPESDGSVIVAGNTSNSTFPTTAGAFQGTLHTLTGDGLPGNLFVTRFDSSGSVLSSTYLGGSVGEQFASLELDASGNPWLTGTTQSPDFPLVAGSPRLGSGFLAGLSSDGTKLLQTQTFPNGAAGSSFTFLPDNEVAVLGSDLIVLPLTATSSPEILGIASATGTAVANQVAPGELISIYGLNLGPAQGAPGSFDATGQLPTTLGGVQVLGNGSPLPLLYVSANQINTVIPLGLLQPIVLQVSGANTSAAVTLPQVIADPSVFSSGTLNGIPEIVAINQDGTLNSSANPAAPGSIVAMWVNGAGAFQSSYPDGSQIPTALSSLAAPVAVLFDGETQGGVTSFGFQSLVTYAGVAPGLVAGIAQVNFQIPMGLPTPGDSTVTLLVGQNLSPTYSIAIQ